MDRRIQNMDEATIKRYFEFVDKEKGKKLVLYAIYTTKV